MARVARRSWRTVLSKLALAGLVSFILGVGPAVSVAEARETKTCTKAQRADGDRWLWLGPEDKALAVTTHLPWGEPGAGDHAEHERRLEQRNYVILHDDQLRTPVWTAARLEARRLKDLDRINCFRRDPRLPKEVASTLADYDEPIFDQGHMTPSGDMTTSNRANVNSFVMSNMTPQFCQLNRGVWQILESLTRRWVDEKKVLYVLTGAVYDRDGDRLPDADHLAIRMKSSNGKRRVAIPSAYYKVVAHLTADGGVETLSLLLPHDQTDVDGPEALAYLTDHITNLAELEAVSGRDLFPDLAVAPLEAATLWAFDGPTPGSLANSPQCHATAGARIDD